VVSARAVSAQATQPLPRRASISSSASTSVPATDEPIQAVKHRSAPAKSEVHRSPCPCTGPGEALHTTPPGPPAACFRSACARYRFGRIVIRTTAKIQRAGVPRSIALSPRGSRRPDQPDVRSHRGCGARQRPQRLPGQLPGPPTPAFSPPTGSASGRASLDLPDPCQQQRRCSPGSLLSRACHGCAMVPF